MTIEFKDRVAIVTGAGNGLGRSHALELAKRGAKVVVNDLGGARDGTGGSISAAEEVVNHINASGGEAIADGANVADDAQVQAMVDAAMEKWGRVDILINNAGILRDKTFHKMEIKDFRAVLEVHLVGSAICTHAVWPIMRDQSYGRVMFTSSPSGLHGIFGQANYGAAKAGMIGIMNALHLEGAKYNIRINLVSPSARTRMTEDLGIPEEILKMWTPEAITAAAIFLVSDDAPSRQIISCAGGGYAAAHIVETSGVFLPPDKQTPEKIAAHWAKISDKSDVNYYENSSGPMSNFMAKAQGK
ncbi:MAG: SDR family NAD(P)-dependent oxidoreductase [Marinicaulis sp.]|nr:SDR family NAD(P)-dependent oxidoreductase [Marinicaulis sp.]